MPAPGLWRTHSGDDVILKYSSNTTLPIQKAKVFKHSVNFSETQIIILLLFTASLGVVVEGTHTSHTHTQTPGPNMNPRDWQELRIAIVPVLSFSVVASETYDLTTAAIPGVTHTHTWTVIVGHTALLIKGPRLHHCIQHAPL